MIDNFFQGWTELPETGRFVFFFFEKPPKNKGKKKKENADKNFSIPSKTTQSSGMLSLGLIFLPNSLFSNKWQDTNAKSRTLRQDSSVCQASEVTMSGNVGRDSYRLIGKVSLLCLLCFNLCACGLFQAQDNDPVHPDARRVVKTAYSQLGKSYRSGGASPSKGFDCSGLLYWVYRKNGYKIPRITTQQAKAGKSVAKSRAREGDILVFKVAQSPRGLHTAISMGKDCFIHSPCKGKKVKVDSVNNRYWKERLIAVRRVIR